MAEEKNGAPPAKLVWPPLADDLKRLYLEQRLSASKIAAVYGLSYASAKTAESTILYHLRKNGISRRDPAAHVRKVTESMVDGWESRYQKGESLKQIAGGDVSPVSVFNHLRRRGVKLRAKVEAQIKAVQKFDRVPFDGTEEDRAYLLGLARGDLAVARHGRAIRVKTSSTHPAMVELVLSLIVPYGPVRVYPRFSKMVGYEWTVEGELDRSFEFLLKKDAPPASGSKSVTLSYLAGLFDAEGSVWLYDGRTFAPRLSFTNKDLTMLGWIENLLTESGFHCRRSLPDRKAVYHTHLWRREDILALVQSLPLRHPEKKAKVRLLLKGSDADYEIYSPWNALLDEIEYDCSLFIRAARSTVEGEDSPSRIL